MDETVDKLLIIVSNKNNNEFTIFTAERTLKDLFMDHPEVQRYFERKNLSQRIQAFKNRKK